MRHVRRVAPTVPQLIRECQFVRRGGRRRPDDGAANAHHRTHDFNLDGFGHQYFSAKIELSMEALDPKYSEARNEAV